MSTATARDHGPVTADARGRARAHWRRQLVLCGVASTVVLVSLAMMAVAAPGVRPPAAEFRLTPDGRVEIARPAEEAFRNLIWPAAAGAAVVTTVFGVALVHTVRVAFFTFRRGDS